MRALLDINVLIALLDAGHIHHLAAQSWMASESRAGWASCPITQNGCIRIMSQPNYPGGPFAMRDIADRLALAAHVNHEFWPDDINILSNELFQWPHILGSRQLTDVYLLSLAIKHGGRLVTLDRGLQLQCVKGAETQHVAIIQ